jgi:hypothetical protein
MVCEKLALHGTSKASHARLLKMQGAESVSIECTALVTEWIPVAYRHT